MAVHYGSNEAAAKETVAEIEAAGGRAFAIGAELGVPGDAAALWAAFDAALAQYESGASGLDILVNNAGVGLFGKIGEVTEAGYDRVFAVNVKAPFFIIQQGLERLRDGGRIVNISSGVTRIAFPITTGYSPTKGALNTLTLTLAQDLGARGITVNAVAPGLVNTDMNPDLREPEAQAQGASSRSSTGSASPRTSATRWPSWPPTTPAGSPARCWTPPGAHSWASDRCGYAREPWTPKLECGSFPVPWCCCWRPW